MRPIEPPELGEIRTARDRIAAAAVRTPLVRLNAGPGAEIWLKLEMLQPIGSFKQRGAVNAIRSLAPEALEKGVYTASAGNMAQGVAWAARELGIPCTVVVPDTAPRTKLDAITRLGARTVPVPFDEWWRVIVEHHHGGTPGTFIHPVANRAVIAGNATIGLEIAEDLPNVATVLVPFGGGGLACGIAAALRVVAPRAVVHACEVETAAPFAASLAAGEPVSIVHTPSFVDGIGGKSMLSEMWPMARALIADSRVVSLEQVKDALRLMLSRARVLAEGAGAVATAAALAYQDLPGPIVCIASGGNIDLEKLRELLGP